MNPMSLVANDQTGLFLPALITLGAIALVVLNRMGQDPTANDPAAIAVPDLVAQILIAQEASARVVLFPPGQDQIAQVLHALTTVARVPTEAKVFGPMTVAATSRLVSSMMILICE